MKKLVFIVMLVLSFSFVLAESTETTDLIMLGVPLYRHVILDDGTSTKEFMDEKGMKENACVIERVNGEYIWRTRGNTKLYFSSSALYNNFTQSDGAGFVKALSMSRYNEKDSPDYIEVVHQGLSVIIYYGKIVKGNLY